MISEFFLLMEFANPMIRGDIGQATQNSMTPPSTA
jgi:hypothetical protein